MSPGAEVRELRRDLRHWRRGRADRSLAEAVGDAYVAVFGGLVLTAMVLSVLVHLRLVSDAACAGSGCRDARALLPWVVDLGSVALALAAARLLGPVFVSPAVASWLLAAPVDRAALLRRRLVAVAAAGALTVLLVSAAAALLGGQDGPTLVLLAVGGALLALAGVGAAATAQAGHRRTVGSLVVAVPGLVAWAGLLALALRLPVPVPVGVPLLAAALVLVPLLLLAAGAVVAALRHLPRLGRDRVAPGGRLAPGLSGALATLDLALAYDVVHASRWSTHLPVRPRRGGPSGPAALVWADLVRVRRTPRTVVLPLLAVVVPYAAAASGAGTVTLLLDGLAGFLTGLPLLAGLRVLTRTPSLLRTLALGRAPARRAALVVPSAVLLVAALAGTPALVHAEGVDPRTGAALALAVGLGALTGAVRWVSGRPPDYSKPLVATPAGAVPTNLYGSALRGFDVLLLVLAPVLLTPTAAGAALSALGSVGVLAHLTARE